MNVQVLTTPGCSSCERLEKMLDEMKVQYKVIDITKNPEILQKYLVMSAPGLVIDEKLEFQGIPSKDELKKAIMKAKK